MMAWLIYSSADVLGSVVAIDEFTDGGSRRANYSRRF